MDDTAHLGAISFIELAANDVEQQGRFYAELMGWSPVPLSDDQTVMMFDNRAVAGIRALQPDAPQGASSWFMYVNVDDVDRACARALALGGAELQAPTDLDGTSRVAVISDPSGAPMCVIEGAQFDTAAPFDEPGAPCWFEEVSTDAAASVGFYEEIFEWHAVQDEQSPLGRWIFLRVADVNKVESEEPVSVAPIGDIMQFPPDIPAGAQSRWQVLFSIHTDIGTFIERATALGGEIQLGPLDTPFGAGCMLTDPGGAEFIAVDRSRAAAS